LRVNLLGFAAIIDGTILVASVNSCDSSLGFYIIPADSFLTFGNFLTKGGVA
jgi:hypothetical protein